jgi:hypothetical protein
MVFNATFNNISCLEKITEFFMQKNDLQIIVLYEILVSGRKKIDTFLKIKESVVNLLYV